MARAASKHSGSSSLAQTWARAVSAAIARFHGTSGSACAACHYYPGAASGMGSNWPAGNGHNVRYDAPVVNTHMKSTGFNYLTDTFASVVADTGKCGLCHRNVKAHRNGTGFAHMSSAGNVNCGTGNFTITVTTPGSNATCGNVKCHSGKTTPNWW